MRGCSHFSPAGGGRGFHLPATVVAGAVGGPAATVGVDAGAVGLGTGAVGVDTGAVGVDTGAVGVDAGAVGVVTDGVLVGVTLLVVVGGLVGGLAGAAVGDLVGREVGASVTLPPRFCLAAAGAASSAHSASAVKSTCTLERRQSACENSRKCDTENCWLLEVLT